MAEKRHGPLTHADWLLALECAVGRGSAALWQGGAVRDCERLPAGVSTAAGLLPAIDILLRRHGVDVAALAAFALAIGPGSFTGLRIGVATVKGLAFGSDVPVAPVSTLAALARAAGFGEDLVVGLLDARRGEVYAGAFRHAGEQADACLPEGVFTPEALAARLPAGCRLVGQGAAVVRPAQAERGFAFAPEVEPSAVQVAELGARLLAQGGGVAAAALVPRYLRRAEAEVRRTGERFEAAAAPGDTSLPPRGVF